MRAERRLDHARLELTAERHALARQIEADWLAHDAITGASQFTSHVIE